MDTRFARHGMESARGTNAPEGAGHEKGETRTDVQCEHRLTPEQRAQRDDARGEHGELFRASLDACEVPVALIAKRTGLTPQYIGRMLRGQDALRPEVIDAAGPHVGVDFAKRLLRRAEETLRRRGFIGDLKLVAMQAAGESGKAQAELADRVADGELCDDDLMALRRRHMSARDADDRMVAAIDEELDRRKAAAEKDGGR